MLKLMFNTVQHYDWGSRTALAACRADRRPTAEPEAELWLGAHPAAPSTVAGDDGPVPLTDSSPPTRSRRRARRCWPASANACRT